MLWTSPCTFYICCQWTTLILRYWYKRVENKFWLLEFSLILCVGGGSGTWPPGSRSSWSWAGQDYVILVDIHLKVVSGEAWLFIYTTLKFVSISLHVHVPGSMSIPQPAGTPSRHPYPSPSWTLTLCGQANFCRYRNRKKVGAELKQEQWFTCQKWEQDIVAKSYVECGIPANCFWPPWPRWRCSWWRCSCFSWAAWPSGSWTGWTGCSAPQG